MYMISLFHYIKQKFSVLKYILQFFTRSERVKQKKIFCSKNKNYIRKYECHALPKQRGGGER